MPLNRNWRNERLRIEKKEYGAQVGAVRDGIEYTVSAFRYLFFISDLTIRYYRETSRLV